MSVGPVRGTRTTSGGAFGPERTPTATPFRLTLDSDSMCVPLVTDLTAPDNGANAMFEVP